MLHVTKRREFIRQVVTGCAGLSMTHLMSRNTFGFQTGNVLAAIPLTDDIALVTGAGANVVVVTSPDGVLLVNGGPPNSSRELLEFVRTHSAGKNVQAVFNTDWHLENTGSNESLGNLGAKIIAHENTKLWLGTDILVEWENRTYPARPKNALPNQTFYTTGKMTFGKHEIRYGHLGQAHTDGDIYVFFPAENILITGDVFRVGAYPIPDYCTNGWLGGLANATKALVGLTDAKTRVVPGSGPVQTRAELESQFEMCNTLKNRIAQLMKEGKGANEIIAAAPTKEFDAKWGNPKVFMSVVYRGLWSHVRELGGIV
jgi:glyoxylase-like metal-dependent hydrolase (beta-lactamase superfamily II)